LSNILKDPSEITMSSEKRCDVVGLTSLTLRGMNCFHLQSRKIKASKQGSWCLIFFAIRLCGPVDGGNIIPGDIFKYLPDYTVLHPRSYYSGCQNLQSSNFSKLGCNLEN
jgi:hypothetical protein